MKRLKYKLQMLKFNIKIWFINRRLESYSYRMLRSDYKIIKNAFIIISIIGSPKNEKEFNKLKKAINDYNESIESMNRIVIEKAKKEIDWYEIKEDIESYSIKEEEVEE